MVYRNDDWSAPSKREFDSPFLHHFMNKPPFVIVYSCNKCGVARFAFSLTGEFGETDPELHTTQKVGIGYGICGEFEPFAIYDLRKGDHEGTNHNLGSNSVEADPNDTPR